MKPWGYTLIEMAAVISLLTVVGCLAASILSGHREYQRFMDQCMRDGSKEVECRIKAQYVEIK